MLALGQEINHSVLGKGEVIYIDEGKDALNHSETYIDIHFEKDSKYMVRTFTEESIKEFLR